MRNKIKETKIFKKLENFQQQLLLKRQFVKRIEDYIVQINNIGFEDWVQKNNPTDKEKKIIKEILKIK